MSKEIVPSKLPRLIPATVGGRLAAVFVPTVVVLLFAAAAVGWAAERQQAQAHEAELHYEAASLSQRAATESLYADALTGQYFSSPIADVRLAVQAEEAQFAQDLQRLRAVMTTLGKIENLDRIDAVITQAAAQEKVRDTVMDLIDQGDFGGAGVLLTEQSLGTDGAVGQLESITASERQEVLNISSQSAQTASLMAVAIASVFFAIIVVSLVTAIGIARSVIQPLAHLRNTARAIGEGDLEIRAAESGPHEVRELACVLNLMVEGVAGREGALRVSEAYWQSLIKNAQDVIAVFGVEDFKIRYCSPAVTPMLGYLPSELEGRSTDDLIHPDDLQKVIAWNYSVEQRPARSGSAEFRLRHADGHWVDVEAVANFVEDPQSGAFLVVNARDITDRRRDQETITHMAYHDSLTGLPNRMLFSDRLDVALAQAHRSADKVCLLAIDLDRFKIINDTLGHSGGDELLKAAARRLKKIVREGNTVARVGGDEFAVLIAGAESSDDGITVAQRVVEAFRLPFVLQTGSYHSTASVGLSVYPDDGTEAESLLAASDKAMYASKDEGRDTFRRYTSEMEDKGTGWLALEAELRRAIEEGELRVHYQPQVDVSSKRIVGVEALVRWQHPTRGLIAPMEFIPLAEEIGLIVPLGDFVLRQACMDAVQWENEGLQPVTLAVNISHRQFADQKFLGCVKEIVGETGMTPSRLELEITETAALRNIERTRAVAYSLSEMGVRLGIDDFGAGSTSLRYLQDFPITTLKIDRGFITGVADNPSNAAIATSVIALGHQLHLNIIAEGVETQEDLDFLESRDCDQYQGYFCSRPLPVDDFKRMLAKSQTAELTVVGTAASSP